MGYHRCGPGHTRAGISSVGVGKDVLLGAWRVFRQSGLDACATTNTDFLRTTLLYIKNN